MRFLNIVLTLLFSVMILSGCGSPPAGTPAAAGAAGGAAAVAVTGTVTLAITDQASGLAVSNLVIGNPATVTATVLDAAGAVVVGAVVTFTSNAAIGTLTPVSATALTNAAGLATITLDGVAAGADNITATVQVAGAAVTGTTTYSVGAAVVTMSALTFGVNPLSANGSTSVSVNVLSGGVLVTTPVAVTFSSTCSVAASATISSPVTTVNGTATATYSDKGCGAVDSITAAVSGVTSTGNLTITPPNAGSIQFVSALPTQISLKGTGGLGSQETSIVTFKVLDSAGNALAGKLVNFALSTAVGGTALSQPTGNTDALGQVSVSVASGTVSTPVRVIATTLGGPVGATTLQTQSDVLTITTGIPDQDSASLSATKLNIEGLTFDGDTTVLTIRLSDHFNNPVPDGTAVNLISEGAQIVGSCVTAAGACAATLTGSNPRPLNGRVTVLAYAVGEESFTDLNGNGLVDNIGEMIDINAVNSDMPEAFLDYNENNLRDAATEPFIDFNNDGLFTLVDNKYSGVLCNPAAGIFCAPSKHIHVRASIVIVLSGSNAVMAVTPAVINLGGNNPAVACNAPTNVTFRITDVNGNAMPAGTTIAITTTNGTLVGGTSFIVANTNANVATAPTAFNYTVSLKSDATYTPAVVGPPAVPASCSDTTPTGSLSVKVTTPVAAVITQGSVTVSN